MTPRWLARVASSALCVLGTFAMGVIGSCAGGTETGNPSFTAELSYAAYSSTPQMVSVRIAAGVAVVSKAWLVLGDVSFVRSADCGAKTASELQAPGLGVGDHAAGKVITTDFDLDDGSYCEVDLPLQRLVAATDLPAGGPAELVGHTLLLQGQLADGTPFSILSAVDSAMRMLAVAGQFEMNKDMPHVLIGFDVAKWVDGLDWSSAERTAGSIEISSAHNAALLAAFEQRLGMGVALYRDADDDGKLDSSSTPIAQAQ